MPSPYYARFKETKHGRSASKGADVQKVGKVGGPSVKEKPTGYKSPKPTREIYKH